MNGGKIEQRWMDPDSQDPFDREVMAFAESILQLAIAAGEDGGRLDAIMTGAAIAVCRIAEESGRSAVCADMLEQYVADLRSGIPMFHDQGSRA